MKILKVERAKRANADVLEVKYEVDGKVYGMGFSDYEDAMRKIDGVEKFKRIIKAEAIRRKALRDNPKLEDEDTLKITRFKKFEGEEIEI